MNSLKAQARKRSNCLALLLALAASAVLAAPGDDRSRGRDDGGQVGRAYGRHSERQQAPNYQRDTPQRGVQPQRLSPEERRQLRSDIRDAGREIYRQRR